MPRVGYGGMSLEGIPAEVMDEWFAPARRDRAVRRDFVKFATGTPDRTTLLRWFDSVRNFLVDTGATGHRY